MGGARRRAVLNKIMATLTQLYPLVFTPIYKDYIWGGDRIIRRYRRTAPPGIYAESWELADRPEAMSVVRDGPLAGRTLADLRRDYGSQLLGGQAAERFPLLVKLLDARECLSVQVHPDEASAAAVGGEPKTEAWYVIDAEPGALVYAGLRAGVGAETFRRALEAGSLKELLLAVPVRPGDLIYIPGGRVHAIGAGCLLLEVQQNSDTTYRVFDWQRLDRNGQPRQLHVEQALRVIRWSTTAPTHLPPPAGLWAAPKAAAVCHERLRTPYFQINQLVIVTRYAAATSAESFQIIFVEDGALRLQSAQATLSAAAGTTLLLPAALGAYEISALTAPLRIVQISLPSKLA